MAIEPTSLSDILTTPDVPLEPVGNTSGQDFSGFFNTLAGETPADDALPTAAVGNPTPETGGIAETAAPSAPAYESPVDALLLIAEKLGLTGKGKDKLPKTDSEQLPELTSEPQLPPGLAGKAKAYGLTHTAPPTARGPSRRHDKVETSDAGGEIASDDPADECDHNGKSQQSENGNELVPPSTAQPADTPQAAAAPVTPQPVLPASASSEDRTVVDDGAPAAILPPSPSPDFASRPTRPSHAVAPSLPERSTRLPGSPSSDEAAAGLQDVDAPVAGPVCELPAKPQTMGSDADQPVTGNAKQASPEPVLPAPPAKPEALKAETVPAADAGASVASADDVQQSQLLPAVPPSGQLHAAMNQPVASSPSPSATHAQAPAHQQVLEDLLIGNSVEDQWVDRLSNDVQALISSDNREARLHLRPRELGDLSIKVEMKDGQAKVHFTVETAAAQSFIADATPRLQAMMENRGFRLDQASVDVGGNGAGKGGTARHGQQDAQPFMTKAPPSVLAAVASRVAKLTAFERYA